MFVQTYHNSTTEHFPRISPTTHIDTTPIPTVSPTIPPSPDYTPASPDYSPAFDTEFDPSEDPSSDHIPPLPATLPVLSSTDDSSENDIPDTPLSPTHVHHSLRTTLSTQVPCASGALPIVASGKRVGPLPTYRLAVRHSVDYSSSDHFSSDDSSRDSSSSSSSETSSDSSVNALSDPASIRSSFDHSLPTPSSGMRPSHHLCSLVPSIHRSSAAISDRPSHDSSFASPSYKRSRSPAASVSLSSPTLRALSYARTDLLPSPKRIRSPETATDLEGCSEDSFELYVPREAGLGVDFEDESSESSRYRRTNLEMYVDVVRSDGIDIDPEIKAEIDECKSLYADMLLDIEIRTDEELNAFCDMYGLILILNLTSSLGVQDHFTRTTSGTPSTTLTTRLPILNPGEYDLWLMRIEQYFLMTNYSPWEVILNGNKVLKRQVGETEKEYEPTTAEEKQDMKNEMN
ncbi:hypothetical protein Tco_1418824 [Tanacetum coccineum]